LHRSEAAPALPNVEDNHLLDPLGRIVKRTVFGPALLLTLALGLTACGGGSAADAAKVAANPSSGATAEGGTPASADAGGTSGSACTLVTVAEVNTAMGKPAKLTGGAGDICTFGEVADPSTFVYVQIYRDDASMAVPKQLKGTGTEPLTGMGDDAFWQPVAGMVFVQKGSKAFALTLPSFANLTANPDAVKAQMVTLAQAALTRF
jgi:hypothetical protein